MVQKKEIHSSSIFEFLKIDLLFLLFQNPHSIDWIRASSIRRNNSIYVRSGHHDFLSFWQVCKMNTGDEATEIPVSTYFRVSSFFLENMFFFLFFFLNIIKIPRLHFIKYAKKKKI